MVTASLDGTARVWDAMTGRPLSKAFVHKNGVNTATFSPDGKYVITASNDNTARVWDVITGEPVSGSIWHKDMVTNAQFSPDGKYICTVSADNMARMWTCLNGKPLYEPMQHNGAVKTAMFSPDGEYVVTASDDNAARVWDHDSGKMVSERMLHARSVNYAEFSPDGKYVVTASNDKTARVWEAMSGKPISEPMQHENFVTSAIFSPEGQYVLTLSNDKIARVWEAMSGILFSEFMEHDKIINSAKYSSDGKYVVTASNDHTTRIWDADNRKLISEISGHKSELNSAVFSQNGEYVATASVDNTARVWDTLTGKAISEPMVHDGWVHKVHFSPDRKYVVTASYDNTARVWDAATGKQVSDPMHHENIVSNAFFSPNGKYVVTVSDDNTGRLWDASSGIPVVEPMRHAMALNSAAFSPDSKQIVTASADGTARVWELSLYIDDGKEFELFTEAAFGKKINRYGAVEDIDIKRISTIRKITISNSFIDWLLTDPTERPIRPASTKIFHENRQEKLDDFSQTRIEVLEYLTDLSGNDAWLMSACAAKLLYKKGLTQFERDCASFNSKRSTELNPENNKIWYFRSLFLANTGNFTEALKAINRCLNINPNAYDAIYLKGAISDKALYESKRIKSSEPYQTLKSFETYQKFGKKDAAGLQRQFLNDVVRKFMALKMFDKFEAACQNIVELDGIDYENEPSGFNMGKLASSYGNLAYAQILNKNFSLAVISAQRGIELQEEKTWLYSHLGAAYLFDGQYEKAEQIYMTYKDKTVPESEGKLFKDFCLNSFSNYEKLGLTHPDLPKVKIILEGKN